MLTENCPATAATEPNLRAALDEAVANKGKLARARLVLAAGTAHGLDEERAGRLACAVEYFHLASLLLDDLPCMDDADMRRGRPCVHRTHGEATALLAALALINRAYALIGFALAAQPMFLRLQAQACLDACLGCAGLVGGQAQDLRFAEGDRSAHAVSRIAMTKTGALFWLAVYFPALLAAPEEAERRELKALCIYWGLAFQAMDDLRDVLSTSIEEGKTTDRDRLLTRPNLALAIGVPGARERLHRLIKQAGRRCEYLERRGAKWGYLRDFHHDYLVPAASLVPGVAAA
jgi:geranylgeranyl pyrophosphate synthase